MFYIIYTVHTSKNINCSVKNKSTSKWREQRKADCTLQEKRIKKEMEKECCYFEGRAE
jgi:hypothetical protein